MITIKKSKSGGYKVYFQNGVYLGEFFANDDGYYAFWPKSRSGYWEAYGMRAIADKLDEVNEEWDAIVKTDESI
jgi:hypothetical protein